MKKLIWFTVAAIFIVGLSFSIYGFAKALTIGIAVNQTPTVMQEITEASSEPATIETVLAMGDSLARGTGDLTGMGFAGHVVAGLNGEGGAAILFNIAEEGLRTSMLLSQVKEPETAEGIRRADLILISIGGNDIRPIEDVESGLKPRYFDDALNAFTDQLDETLHIIREENGDAFIVFIGLYNLDYSASNAENTGYLLEWNCAVQRLVASFEKSLFIPTYDLFQLNASAYLSADGLHPNAEGHAAIGDRILKNIERM